VHVPLVDFLYKLVDIGEVSVLRQHGQEVAYVVATVPERRLVEREQPYAIDSEPLEVVEFFYQPSDVPGSVVVGIVEAAHQHLIKDGGLVPALLVHRFSFPGSYPASHWVR
jgi:hypothetical protein